MNVQIKIKEFSEKLNSLEKEFFEYLIDKERVKLMLYEIGEYFERSLKSEFKESIYYSYDSFIKKGTSGIVELRIDIYEPKLTTSSINYLKIEFLKLSQKTLLFGGTKYIIDKRVKINLFGLIVWGINKFRGDSEPDIYDDENNQIESDYWFDTYLNNRDLFSNPDDILLKIDELIIYFIDLMNLQIDSFFQSTDGIKSRKSETLILFDKDNNGELDILEGDNLLIELMEKHQTLIVEFDHSLIQNLVRLNKFLISKRDNLKSIFNFIKEVDFNEELDELILILNKGIENYQSLLIHSLNMVISLKEKEIITYYEIYESFDKLGIFNSSFEKDISSKLSSIDTKLSTVISSINEVIFSIRSMENSISSKLSELTYTTKSSFEKVNLSLNNELKSIRSGVQWNNLLTGIQTYQTYKLRRGN